MTNLTNRAVTIATKITLLTALAGVPLHSAFSHEASDVDADVFPWSSWQDLLQCSLLLHRVGYSAEQGLDRCSLPF
jgi:hypothetical protein